MGWSAIYSGYCQTNTHIIYTHTQSHQKPTMSGCFAWGLPCQCFAGLFGVPGRVPDSDLQAYKGEHKRYARIQGLSPLARASRKSPEKEVHEVFQQIRGEGTMILEEDLNMYLCVFLGYGQAEAYRFSKLYGTPDRGISFSCFKQGYSDLNPFFISKRSSEILVRKPGSLSQQQVILEDLCNCEVYICDPPGQVFVDGCKDCLILVTAFDGPACFRDCQGCTFWAASQQVRVKDCRSCTFYVYAKTPPTMVNCKEISTAPWCASFLNCRQHFESAGFDVQRNFWNSFFDFSGNTGCLRICALHEVVRLLLYLDEGEHSDAPENPCPVPTHAVLCQGPLCPDEEGQSIAQIPQSPPCKPDPPLCSVLDLEVKDSTNPRLVGASFLNQARSWRQQKLVLNLISRSACQGTL